MIEAPEAGPKCAKNMGQKDSNDANGNLSRSEKFGDDEK